MSFALVANLAHLPLADPRKPGRISPSRPSSDFTDDHGIAAVLCACSVQKRCPFRAAASAGIADFQRRYVDTRSFDEDGHSAVDGL